MGHYYDCRYCHHEVNCPCENMAQAKECSDFAQSPRRSTAMLAMKKPAPKRPRNLPFPVISK